jgi:hypothetical protein
MTKLFISVGIRSSLRILYIVLLSIVFREYDMSAKSLQIRLRQHHGRQLLPKLLNRLSQILDKPKQAVQLLDLEETDSFLEAFEFELDSRRKRLKPAFQRSWRSNESEELQKFLNKLRKQGLNRRMILFTSLSEYCGAVEIMSHEVLEHALQLISLDQEEVLAMTYDSSYGIVLGYNTERIEKDSVEMYDLLIWGEDWLAALTHDLSSFGYTPQKPSAP